MNVMFDLFDLIFPVMFLLIFGMILFTFISGIRTWNKNNNSPRLTVEARVTAKRQNTTHHNEPVGGDTSGTHGYHTTTSTSYYVTFEVRTLTFTFFCAVRTSCVEQTSARRITWARKITLKDDTAGLLLRIRNRNCREKCSCIRMPWICIKFFFRSCLYDSSKIHNTDSV